MQGKRWQDLTGAQRFGMAILGFVQLSLLVAGLWDLSRREEEEVHGGKGVWTVLMFVNYIGPIAYFLLGRKRSNRRYISI